MSGSNCDWRSVIRWHCKLLLIRLTILSYPTWLQAYSMIFQIYPVFNKASVFVLYNINQFSTAVSGSNIIYIYGHYKFKSNLLFVSLPCVFCRLKNNLHGRGKQGDTEFIELGKRSRVVQSTHTSVWNLASEWNNCIRRNISLWYDFPKYWPKIEYIYLLILNTII